MTLVSPGVETSIIDESLYVPNASSLVPLFFIATQDEKTLSSGEPAPYTYEHSVVRSITSLRASINAYGEPVFLTDGSGNQLHGDARNEYGLFAMNQYLGIGNGAYAVRANVNLNDSLDDIQDQWDVKSDDASVVIQNMIQNYINNVNLANGLTVDGASVLKNVSTKIASNQIQTEQEYDGTLPYGSAIVGTAAVGVASGFAVGDRVVLSNGSIVTITSVDSHLGATGTGEPTTFEVTPPTDGGLTVPGTTFQEGGIAPNISSITNSALQDVTTGNSFGNTPRTGFTITPQLANLNLFIQTDVDFAGNFAGGTNYAVNDVITLSNNSQVKVVAVNGSGSVTSFALLTQGETVLPTVDLTQISVSPQNTVTPQTGFQLTPQTSNIEEKKTTVSGEELKTIVVDATNFIFDEEDGVYAFKNLSDDFFDEKNDSDPTLPNSYQVFPNGFDYTATGTFIGFDGEVAAGVASAGGGGNAVIDEWTPAEGADLFGEVATSFKFTIPFLNKTSLGANDAARRVSIVAALQEAIVSNTDVRSENFQFNVIAAPGYPEVVDELLALSVDQKSEALVVAETPPNLAPEGVTNPTNGWAATTARQNSTDVCYYYPWCYASNLDGVNVLAAPSGTAIRQMAYNDNISYLWYAPAGVTRGLVSGVTDVGYASGILGEATNFISVALNQGQRDALYQDTASGKINPIVYQPGKGIALMGQKTSAPTTTALDRINVVRLTMYVRRQLRLAMVGFLFEPNDQRTRDNAKAVADNFLGTIMTNRGIVDFLTVCDDSNNTADVVDRSEMILDVLIKPTKAVEFISIPIRIVSQGADI